ncbi:MAG: MFS transporter [Methanobacterium sp.]|jgi:EmrB/QacA subfamily drug resistance transporter|nr:MFS transporter [Methanobacterium sp.]
MERKWKILLSVALGTIMVPINATIVNVSLPTIAEYFQVTIPIAQWIINSYLITLVCLVLLFGRLGAHYGKKTIYVTGLLGFLFSSFLCYLSPSILVLIISRALQGVTAAMMLSVSMGIVKDAFPEGERGKGLGIYAVAIATGMALGPTIGGIIDFMQGWRHVFLFNIPLGIISFLLCYWTLKNDKTSKLRLNIGSVVLQFFWLFFMVCVVSETQIFGIVPETILFAFLSILFLILFIHQELKSDYPLIDVVLFKDFRFTVLNLALMFSYISLYMIFFAMPFYMEKVLHLNSYNTGLILTVTPLTMMLVAPFSGKLSDKIGSGKPAFTGSVLCLIAFTLMTQLNSSSSQGEVMFMLAIMGIGIAFFQSPNNSAIMSCFPGDASIISSIIVTMRNLGMILGGSMAAVILHTAISAQSLEKAQLFSLAAYDFSLGLERLMIFGMILSIMMAICSLSGLGLGRKISCRIKK